MAHLMNSIIKKPMAISTAHTTAQITSTTGGSTNVIIGSEATYEPAANSVKVVYEITYYAEKINGYNFGLIQLEKYEGGSWSEINAKFRQNPGNWGVSQDQRWYFHYRFIVPSWTGAKQLRLNNVTYSYQTANALTIHQMTKWDGSASTDKFCNTNLLIYSI